MFIVSPATVWNAGALDMRQVPRRIFGRVTLWPRRGAGFGLWARIVFEVEVLRYLSALLPFVVAAAIWRDSAVAISQAPLPMFLVIYLFEIKVLRLSPAARKALIPGAEADRGLDLLRVRAVTILTRIAAGRGLTEGRLHLVVEQSELARIAPLTFVSVQTEDGPAVMRLTQDEEAMIRAELFADGLDEGLLQRINLAQGDMLRDVAFDLRGVSAHARLAALIG
jgi:hypothetical protein